MEALLLVGVAATALSGLYSGFLALRRLEDTPPDWSAVLEHWRRQDSERAEPKWNNYMYTDWSEKRTDE